MVLNPEAVAICRMLISVEINSKRAFCRRFNKLNCTTVHPTFFLNCLSSCRCEIPKIFAICGTVSGSSILFSINVIASRSSGSIVSVLRPIVLR